MQHAINEDGQLMENIVMETEANQYVVHINSDGLDNRRENLVVRPMSDITKLIKQLPGLQWPQRETNNGLSWTEQRKKWGTMQTSTPNEWTMVLQLNGTKAAWTTLADLRDIGASVEFQDVEGLNGFSFWNLSIPKEIVEDFSLLLRSVLATNAAVVQENERKAQLRRMPPGL
jgi:hypothetical protein